MKPVRVAQKLQARIAGYQESMRTVPINMRRGYRMPGSQNPHKQH